MTLFVVTLLLSVYPTVQFLRRRRAGDDEVVVYPGVVGGLLRAQLASLLAMPLLAVLVARGFGY